MIGKLVQVLEGHYKGRVGRAIGYTSPEDVQMIYVVIALSNRKDDQIAVWGDHCAVVGPVDESKPVTIDDIKYRQTVLL